MIKEVAYCIHDLISETKKDIIRERLIKALGHSEISFEKLRHRAKVVGDIAGNEFLYLDGDVILKIHKPAPIRNIGGKKNRGADYKIFYEIK